MQRVVEQCDERERRCGEVGHLDDVVARAAGDVGERAEGMDDAHGEAAQHRAARRATEGDGRVDRVEYVLLEVDELGAAVGDELRQLVEKDAGAPPEMDVDEIMPADRVDQARMELRLLRVREEGQREEEEEVEREGAVELEARRLCIDVIPYTHRTEHRNGARVGGEGGWGLRPEIAGAW